MSKLQGKKILLIAPVFFGYENHIRSELISRGAIVDYVPDRPFSSQMLKALIRFAPILTQPISNSYFKKIFTEKSDQNYDYLFVIQGEALGVSSIKLAKQLFPKVSTKFYLWDSIANKKNTLKKLPFFKEVFTFDRSDAKEFNLSYRPLFFISDPHVASKTTDKYLISFIGTVHSDRYKICKKVGGLLPKTTTSFFYLYLQAPWVYFVRKLFNPSFWHASIHDFKFRPLSKNDMSRVFEDSFSVLDIEHPKQRGLTMRTFDVLASGKKLITTNDAIRSEDFYISNNVLIIDRGVKIDFNSSFFSTPFTSLPVFFHQKYSLKGWIDEIFHQT